MARMAIGRFPPVTYSQLESITPALELALARLRETVLSHPCVVVAYSGGVDSSLVAAIAVEQHGASALAITGVSAALAPQLRQEARAQAAWLGIAHREVPTAELDDPAYTSNPPDRCYACKHALHSVLKPIAAAAGDATVLDGVNHDDLSDHRPGIRAAHDQGVCSPLAESGIDKSGVRQLSRALGLPWWDKPATPCLASRIAYGEPVTAERMVRIAAAEAWLRQRGFPELRVRSQGETARIELPAERLREAMELWQAPEPREELVQTFRQLGFIAVGLDLEGLVSGKLNRSLN